MSNESTPSIAQLSARIRRNPDCEALEHQLMSARLERSIELGINVSPEDAELLYSYTWSLSSKGYPLTNIKLCNGKQKSVNLNRLILSRMLGCDVCDIPTNIEADHIYEDLGLANCRRENIQPLTSVQNKKKKASRKARAKAIQAELVVLPDGNITFDPMKEVA